MSRTNEFGQPIGPELGGWQVPAWPSASGLSGRRVELVPLDVEAHADQLFDAFKPASDALWTYMSFGPFATRDDVARTIEAQCELEAWRPYAVVVSGSAVGLASYLRIDPANGCIEIGSLAFAPALQRTTATTEALFLMIDHCFDLGYRRCEWKCDDLNEPSHVAARRLGFQYEGTFRQATHYKGRSRDTAWYAIVDGDWPMLRDTFVSWLSPDNFDQNQRQLATLESFGAVDPD